MTAHQWFAIEWVIPRSSRWTSEAVRVAEDDAAKAKRKARKRGRK